MEDRYYVKLPRVRRVLSLLAGLAPESLLDVGNRRGTFLWLLPDAFPSWRSPRSITTISVRPISHA